MGISERQKETIALVAGLLFVSSVYLYAFIQVYTASNVVRETTFTVFDSYWHKAGRTQIMTYGAGQYYFMGNYTKEFKVDHTYRVKYYSTLSGHATGADPPRYFLKIIEITEVPK